MKILFSSPESTKLFFEGRTVIRELMTKILGHKKSSAFPILAALTPKEYSIDVIEGAPHDIDYNKEYDLIGMTCNTPGAPAAYEIADEFRRRGVTVVLGGWHPSALPHEAKQHADSVVIGEAEETWPQLLRDFENGKLKPFYTIKRPVDPKLIPYPRNIYPKGTRLTVQATRGCPYSCEFCAITSMKFRNIYRMRAIKDVIEEIKSLPTKTFTFYDDSLTINTTYTKQLFKEMKYLNKKFGAFGNIGVLGRDDELLKLASEAGCIRWLIGFESVCQESLDSVGKKMNRVEDYLKSIKKIHDHGMIIDGFFVFGFDHDTLDTFDETDAFIDKSEIDVLTLNILTPLPGTLLFDRLDKEGRILTKDWSRYNQKEVVFQPKNMTPEELLINTRRLHKKWYTTSCIIKRITNSLSCGYYPFANTVTQNLYWVRYQ